MNSKILLPLALALVGGASASCGWNDMFAATPENCFGIFGHSGIYLPEYAVAEITLPEAKDLIYIAPTTAKTLRKASLEDENETVKSILAQYACLSISVNYYVTGAEEEQVRVDLYQGTDFLALLADNTYAPFGQMNVKYIYVDDGLLDGLEEENVKFHEDLTNLVSPFDRPYTYHRSEAGELILQTHHFAELPSSVNGGIGATFRQDCELVFDAEGKITLWQSSLGLYTSTPTGTALEGYIFEASFSWTEK